MLPAVPPRRESDFVFLPVEEAEAILVSEAADPRWRYERLVRRLPPDYEPELVAKVPAFLLAQAFHLHARAL
jgi:hypothetical protein